MKELGVRVQHTDLLVFPVGVVKVGAGTQGLVKERTAVGQFVVRGVFRIVRLVAATGANVDAAPAIAFLHHEAHVLVRGQFIVDAQFRQHGIK
ncbi:hypothetical protein D3C81_1547970 [compost metagenome]